MIWKKYTIHTTEEAEDLVSAALYELGITSVEIEDKRPASEAEMMGLFGDVVPEMPEDVIRMIEEADIILSKGQANFETLRHCERNAYYLFLCKCDMFANQFQVEPFTGMFIHESDSKNGILE